jgi:hypothetical protein
MKQNNLFIAILIAMLLLSVGAKAQVSSVLFDVGNASYECFYEQTASNKIIPLRAVLVRYSSTATATSFEIPPQVRAIIGLNYFNFDVEGITGWTSGTTPTVYHGAFENNTHLESIRIPATVGIIGEKSFCNSHLAKVVFSGTPILASIGPSAFKGCSYLTDITIPASVTNIRASAFEGCTSLNSAHLPSGLTSLGRAAFKGCTSLYAYSFGGLTSIPESAYEGCTSISYLGLPYDLTSVGANAFKGCTGLTDVDIYATMQNIAPTAFADCNPDNVTYTIKPSDNVTTVADGLMQNCECVGKVVLADGITAVGSDAFNGCNVLCRLELTTSVRSIGSNALNVTSNFRVDVNSSQGEHKDIANDLFSNVSSLTTVNINSGVTAVGEGAFGRCSDLKNININEDSELSIGVRAFLSCTSLKEISFPGNVSSIGQGAFQFCPALEIVGLFITTSVKPNSFSAADGDEALPTLTIYPEENNFSVPDEKYNYLQGISKVVVSEGITSIGVLSFHGMTSLEAVELPTSLESIGNYAFQACSNLESLTMYTTTTSIGESAFSDCGNLSVNIDAHETNTTIADNLFKNCQKMVSLTTNGVTAIGENAFKGCTSLSTVSLPNGLTTIGPSSFENCTSLTQVDIPVSVTSLGAQAFNCSNLTEVTVKWFTPLDDVSTQSDPFPTNKRGITLHVPFGLIPDYQAHDYWGLFGNIVMPDTYEVTDNQTVQYRLHVGATEEENWAEVIGLYDHENITVIDIPSPKIIMNMPFPVTTIAADAFKDCTNIANVTLPASVTTIGQAAFSGCTGLRTLTVSSNLRSIGAGTFNDSGLFELVVRCDPTHPNIVQGFASQIPTIQKAFIYEGIESIGDMAFASCSELSSVSFYGEDLKTIGTKAFYNCPKIETLSILQSVESIGDKAFGVPEGVTSSLNSVTVSWQTPLTMPDGVDPFPTHSGITLKVPFGKKEAYSSDPYWGDFNIDVATQEIAGGPHLVRYRLHEDATAEYWAEVIGMYDQQATSVDIESSKVYNNLTFPVIKIAENAFRAHPTLQTVNLPNTITTIGENAFFSCDNMVTLDFLPEGLETIGESAFEQCAGLTSVELPSTLKVVSSSAFQQCVNLQQVKLNEGLETIGYAAFGDCGALQSISIPSTVETIDDFAFASSGVSKVYVYWQTPLSLACYPHVFDEIADGATLYVPVGTKASYANSAVWSDFQIIEQYNANGDGFIDINDVLAIVDYILGNAPANFDVMAADANGDGDVSIADAAAVLNIILSGNQ